MKHVLALIAGILLIWSAPLHGQSDSAQCKKFRTGTFYDVKMPEVKIERDSVYQIETNGEKTSYYKVTWIDACTYELSFIKSTDPQMRKSAALMGDLHITITEVFEDGYRYTATAKGLPIPVSSVMRVKR